MTKLTKRQIALSLIQGAGIVWWQGRAFADPYFTFRSPKATRHAMELIERLYQEVVRGGEVCDFITLFEDRPATLELGRRLANRLSQHWHRNIGVLSIRREKWRTIFHYYPDEISNVIDFERLSTAQAQQIFTGKTVLLFADLLRGEDNEGIIRTIETPAVKRHGIKIIGLATLAVGERGARKRLRKAAGNPEFPVFHLVHFGENAAKPSEAEKAKTEEAPSFLKRLLGRAAL